MYICVCVFAFIRLMNNQSITGVCVCLCTCKNPCLILLTPPQHWFYSRIPVRQVAQKSLHLEWSMITLWMTNQRKTRCWDKDSDWDNWGSTILDQKCWVIPYLLYVVYMVIQMFSQVWCGATNVTRHSSLSTTHVGGASPCAGHKVLEDRNYLIFTPL